MLQHGCIDKGKVLSRGKPGDKGVVRKIISLSLLAIAFLVPLAIYKGTYNYVLIKLSLTQALMFLILILWIGRSLWSGGQLERVKVPLTLPISLFFFLALLSLFASEYPWAGPPEIYRLTTYLLLYGLTVNTIRDRRSLSGIVFVWLLSTGIVSFYGLCQYFFKGMVLPRSTFGNANFFGAYLMLSFPLAFALFIYNVSLGLRKNWLRILSLATLLLVMSFSLFLASSRGAWLGLGVSLVSLGWLGCIGFKSKWIATRAIPACLVFILVLMAVLAPWLLEREFVEEELERGTLGLRILIWEGAVRMIAARPLLGSGIGSFQIAYPSYRLPEYFGNPHAVDSTTHAHNEFLEIAAETGILGLAAFLGILIVFFIKGIDVVRREEDGYKRVLTMGLISGVAGLLATNLVGVNLRFPSSAIFFWLAVGLVMSQSPVASYELYPYTLIPLRAQAGTGGHRRVTKLSSPLRQAVFGLALLVVLFMGWQGVVKPFLAERYFKEGIKYRTEGDWDKAISEYNRTIEIAPHFVEVYYRLGFAYAQTGNLDEAISAYNRVKELAPNYARLHNNLAVLYLKKGNREEAIESFRRALSLNPYDGEGHNDLGNLYAERGEWNNALAEYKKALALKPDDIDVLTNLRKAYRKSKDVF